MASHQTNAYMLAASIKMGCKEPLLAPRKIHDTLNTYTVEVCFHTVIHTFPVKTTTAYLLPVNPSIIWTKKQKGQPLGDTQSTYLACLVNHKHLKQANLAINRHTPPIQMSEERYRGKENVMQCAKMFLISH